MTRVWRNQVGFGLLSGAIFLGISNAETIAQQGASHEQVTAATVAKAKAGDVSAEAALGDAYMSGRGVKLDIPNAINWYKKAAEHGDLYSQMFLANVYADGIADLVSVDLAKSFAWFRSAAEQGLPRAELEVAMAYASGRGVTRNDVEAARWMQKAAAHGEAFAEYALGSMYDEGSGLPQDEAEAVKWYTKAAMQNLDRAQYRLGIAYARGKGTAIDAAEAYFWLNLSGVTVDDARPERDKVAQSLTAAVKREVQARCLRWFDSHSLSRQ